MKIAAFWWEWLMVEFLYGLLILTSYVMNFPAYLLKVKYNKDWLDIYLNTDLYGSEWWLEREGLTPSFWSFLRWHWRNPAWGFHKYIQPKSHADTEIIKIYAHQGEGHILRWCNRDRGHYGYKHVYFTASGTLYGRLSFADEKSEIMLGTSGNRYVCRVKNIGHLITLIFK